MFTFSHIYELPFGKGKPFANNLHPALNHVVGNWQLGGLFTAHTGFPLTIRGPDNSNTNSRGARASVVGTGGDTLGQVGPGSRWFDTSVYATAARGTLGNAGNGTERGPGLKMYNFSIHKQFPIRESIKAEFRAEFANLTNTPLFNAPNRTVNSATFGEVSSAQGERAGSLALKLYF